MHSADEIFGGLQASIAALNDNSGFLAVLVAVAAGLAAFRQLQVWREETTGKTKYQVALNYRRSLFRLHDAIVDLRYPVIRLDEVNENPDEKHESSPEPGSSREEWKAYTDTQSINIRENDLNRKRWLFNLRWKEMMTKYRLFQDHLLEARVHSIREDRFCVELDVFLSKVYHMFHLRFAEMQDAIWDSQEAPAPDAEERDVAPFSLADSERKSLREVGLLPPTTWSTEKPDITSVDQLETDLQVEIDRLSVPVSQHMLENTKADTKIRRILNVLQR